MKALLALFILMDTTWAAETLIRVRPHVVVSPGVEVKLAQLVDGAGLSSTAESALLSTSMTKAPAYGERQVLDQASLREVLRPIVQAERLLKKSPVHLLMPKTVVIDTVKRELTSERVWAELKQVWQPLCADCQLVLEGLSLPAVQGVRDWSLKLKPELPRGGFSIPVSIIRADTAPVSAWISGRLVIKRKVPVMARAISIGERIQANDLAWEYRDTSFATDGIPSEEGLIGQKIKMALRAGDVVWAGAIEKEKAIRRGETVQVKSGEGAWEVSLSVVAQQDAMIGDVINLKNPKTNNNLMGLVTGQGEVELR